MERDGTVHRLLFNRGTSDQTIDMEKHANHACERPISVRKCALVLARFPFEGCNGPADRGPWEMSLVKLMTDHDLPHFMHDGAPILQQE